jgi:hypothetical protein
MRSGTLITLQYWGMLVAIFAALAGLASYVAFRVWMAFDVGEIALGRHGEWLFHRVAEPFWFWFAIFWHVAVFASILGVIVYFALETRRGLRIGF